MPLLSGMTGAGAQEEPPHVAVDVSLWEPPLLDRLQAQLGLQVKELTAQLEQETAAMSRPNVDCDRVRCR